MGADLFGGVLDRDTIVLTKENTKFILNVFRSCGVHVDLATIVFDGHERAGFLFDLDTNWNETQEVVKTG